MYLVGYNREYLLRDFAIEGQGHSIGFDILLVKGFEDFWEQHGL